MTKNPAAVALGSIRSAKKAASSAANGALGGRPKKDATHYLHHQFLMEQNGKYMQVWRLLPAKNIDNAAHANGDITKIVRKPAPKVGVHGCP